VPDKIVCRFIIEQGVFAENGFEVTIPYTLFFEDPPERAYLVCDTLNVKSMLLTP
jgi:hypothetical protein